MSATNETNKFEDLYENICKIVELTERVPPEMRNEVFKTLFDVLKGGKEHSRTEEILVLTNNGTELKDFIIDKKPVSNIERSLLFVYFLNLKGIKNVSAEHIEACYKICELNMPGNLTQNLRDASSTRYGYLENIQNHYHVTQIGLQFCEN